MGVSGYVLVQVTTATNSDESKNATATCSAAKVATGGGAQLTGAALASGKISIAASYPTTLVNGRSTAWAADAVEFANTNDTWQLTVTVICVNAS